MKLSQITIQITLILTAVSSLLSLPATVYSQPQQITQSPPPPPPTGTPISPQKPGGTRPLASKCPSEKDEFALFSKELVKTSFASPTFWFYIPYLPQNVNTLTFVILDDQDEYFQTPRTLSLPENPGFVGLRRSSTLPPLEAGKRYRWYFTISCDPNDKEDRLSFSGVIERANLSPNELQSLETETPTEQISYLIEKGFNYDAFSLLTELRRNNPTEPILKAEWEKLLPSEILSHIQSQAFYATPLIISE